MVQTEHTRTVEGDISQNPTSHTLVRALYLLVTAVLSLLLALAELTARLNILVDLLNKFLAIQTANHLRQQNGLGAQLGENGDGMFPPCHVTKI